MSGNDSANTAFRSSLNEMRLESFLCDVTLVAQHVEMPVHRNVLAAGSPFFRQRIAAALQSGAPLDRITLSGVRAEVLPAIVEHLYTGRVLVHENRVCALLDAATELQLPAVRDACLQQLGDQLRPDTCLRIRRLADLYDSAALRSQADAFIERNSATVVDSRKDSLDSFDGMTVYPSVVPIVSDEARDAGAVEAVGDGPQVMMIIGGVYGYSEPNRMLCYDFEDNRWYQAANLPWPSKTCIGAVTIDSLVYVFHGYVKMSTGTYDPAADTWHQLPELHMDFYPIFEYGSIVAYGHCIYFLGFSSARENRNYKKMFVFNVHNRLWLPNVATMSASHKCCGAAVLNGHVYAIGGGSAKVERYDVAANRWQSIAPMSTKRILPSCAVLDGLLYVMGGGSDTAEVYDPVADRWRLLPDNDGIPNAMVAVPHAGELFIVNRSLEHMYQLSKELVVYTPATNKWRTMLSPMPYQLYYPPIIACVFDRPAIVAKLPPSGDCSNKMEKQT